MKIYINPIHLTIERSRSKSKWTLNFMFIPWTMGRLMNKETTSIFIIFVILSWQIGNRVTVITLFAIWGGITWRIALYRGFSVESVKVTFMQNFQHIKEIPSLSDTVPTHLEILLSRFLWKQEVGKLRLTIRSVKGS